MPMTDPLGDMLTRIRNGQQARKDSILTPASKLRANVLDVLQREGYIRGYAEEELAGQKGLRIELKYFEGQPAIQHLARLFLQATHIPHHHNPPVCHHWQCAESGIQRFAVQLLGSACFQIEVPNYRVDDCRNELSRRVFLLVIVLAADVIDRVECPSFQGIAQGSEGCRRHSANIESTTPDVAPQSRLAVAVYQRQVG